MPRTYRLPTTLLLVLAAACGGGTSDSGPAPIKIGAIFALTGPTSDVGVAFSEGVRDHVEWVNDQGGIAGHPIDLIYQDYGYKVDVAEQLYSQFVQEGAVAFMGWGTGDTEALLSRVAADRIPFASASFSHVLGDPAEAPYNFLLGTSYSDQLFIVLDWIAEQHPGESPKVALMHHASPFGLSPYEQGGRDYAAKLGIALEPHEMPSGATDLTAELTNIRESGAQYVVFQNTPGPASLALKNAASMGFAPTFVCLNWCTNEVTIELAGPAAEGLVGSVLYSPPADDIPGYRPIDEFLRSKGSSMEDKGLLYGQGWWMMAILLQGVRGAAAAGGPITGPAIRDALESLDGFDTGGVTRPISFSPESHRGMRSMRLYEVEGGAWKRLTEFRSAG